MMAFLLKNPPLISVIFLYCGMNSAESCNAKKEEQKEERPKEFRDKISDWRAGLGGSGRSLVSSRSDHVRCGFIDDPVFSSLMSFTLVKGRENLLCFSLLFFFFKRPCSPPFVGKNPPQQICILCGCVILGLWCLLHERILGEKV